MITINHAHIAGRRCHIYFQNPSAPYIYWAMQMHESDDVERMAELVQKKTNNRSFNLIAFEANEWNQDFSPWKAPAVFGSEAFDGKGSDTLDWLINNLIPTIEGTIDTEETPVRFIAGYSLAGLFALWTFYNSNAFIGAASCSGSLWFPGWNDFVKDSRAPEQSLVYLSLGTKESKTKNKIMASVGAATEETSELLKSDANISKTVFEWNPGGHFNNPIERTAKGIAWLLTEKHFQE